MLRFRPGVALLVIDVQNDFAAPEGSLSVAGAPDVIPVINRAADLARRRGAMVVLTQDWHPESTPHFQKDGGIWPVHCVAGTWGAELYPGLDVPTDTSIIRKGTNGEDGYSGFTMRDPATGQTIATELEALLRANEVTDVVVLGLATDYCVKATALDAIGLGFHATVLTTGCAAVNLERGDGDKALEDLESAGVHLHTARVH